jgi:hypothetical protein
MGKEVGYIILEVGYEYNDEYYHTGNYGEMYEAPEKVFTNKDKALLELRLKTMEKMRGEDLGRYNGNGLKGICKTNMIDQFKKLMLEEFELDAEDWELEIPQDATDLQLEKILECLDLKFFELVEVEIN